MILSLIDLWGGKKRKLKAPKIWMIENQELEHLFSQEFNIDLNKFLPSSVVIAPNRLEKNK